MSEINSEINRDMLFISHATEDNDFSRWISLKLAKTGYGVWCDLTKLLGGEDWPKEINDALKNRTAKFLFVLSTSSNVKTNPLNEFQLALTIQREFGLNQFVIPLRVENIQQSNLDFRFHNIQWVDFTTGWADGFVKLQERLRTFNIPQNAAIGPENVRQWWETYATGSTGYVVANEKFYSNSYYFNDYPKSIFKINPSVFESDKIPKVHLQYSDHLLAIEPVKINSIGLFDSIKSGMSEISVEEILNGTNEEFKDIRGGKNKLKELLQLSLRDHMIRRGLLPFKLANSECYYFSSNNLSKGNISFGGVRKLSKRTKLWGKRKQDTWHFALETNVVIGKSLKCIFRPHVLLNSYNKISAAPRTLTKSWRNDDWRDRLYAAIYHLSQDNTTCSLTNTNNIRLELMSEPSFYNSEFDYKEPI